VNGDVCIHCGKKMGNSNHTVLKEKVHVKCVDGFLDELRKRDEVKL
jgi:hypothetical protein